MKARLIALAVQKREEAQQAASEAIKRWGQAQSLVRQAEDEAGISLPLPGALMHGTEALSREVLQAPYPRLIEIGSHAEEARRALLDEAQNALIDGLRAREEAAKDARCNLEYLKYRVQSSADLVAQSAQEARLVNFRTPRVSSCAPPDLFSSIGSGCALSVVSFIVGLILSATVLKDGHTPILLVLPMIVLIACAFGGWLLVPMWQFGSYFWGRYRYAEAYRKAARFEADAVNQQHQRALDEARKELDQDSPRLQRAISEAEETAPRIQRALAQLATEIAELAREVPPILQDHLKEESRAQKVHTGAL